MKKLMILGGSRYALPVIRAAHDLGLYVITCDYLPDNIAHKYSDEYCNVSIIDKEATLEAARSLEIDGVISFACDPGVATAAYVAEKMGLPSVGSYEAVSILQNKGKFRKFLADNGFNVPTAKGYTSIDEAIKDVAMFHWPVIVKPTDSAGSKGVTRVDNPDDLRKSIEYALSFSHCDEFIVEDFIQQHGFSSDTDSFSVDGELKFVSFNSQRFDANAENPYTPAAYSWPSSMTEEHQKELASELQRLITLLNLKTSVYNIETREGTDGKAYIMECSPRGGGNRLSECLEYATGVKLVENAVRAAVGMPIIGIEQKPYDGCWAEVVLHSNKPGIFDGLWISDEIKNNVIERDLWIEPGTKVGGFTAANEAIGTLVLKFESEERLQKVMSNVKDFVDIKLRGGEGYSQLSQYASLARKPFKKLSMKKIFDNIKNGDKSKMQVLVGNPYFYLSDDTGAEILTGKTIDEIYLVYDSLCMSYPQWIHREDDIGLDSAGNGIRHYTIKNQFAVVNNNEIGTKPNMWTFENDCKHILLNAGFHGNEKSSVWGVMLLAKDIIESNDGWAMYIKSNIVLDIIPIACPWNFNNNSRCNSNGIDCCFDFVNTISSEARAVARFLNSIKNRCIAVIDSHNNPHRDCKTCFMEQRPTDKFFLLQNRMCSQIDAFVSDNWKKYYRIDELPFLHMVAGEWKVSYTSFSWYFAKKGMYGLTVETPCNLDGGDICSSQVCKFTKDIIGNMIIAYCGIL